jgi:signal transduction histidine kinase
MALQQLVAGFDRAGALNAVPLRLQRAGGDLRDCLVTAVPLGDDTPTAVFCLVRDITDQLAHDADLRSGYDTLAAQLAQAVLDNRAAHDGLARAEGQLHEFTRTVAHDLKTPLSAVQGFAGLLRERLLAGHLHDAQRYTEHITRAAQHMAAMIDALAGLARVTRGPLQRQPVDMQQLAHDSWALLAAAHPDRQVHCRFEPLPATQADADLVAQVWQNLLGNAAKYSAQGPRPTVSVDSYHDARGTWYRITDNGVGFDRAHAKRLFQPFQRMHSGAQFEGSGVGLSLVRRIVDHHGGEVRLHSKPGQGTVAEFTLDPLA